MKPKEIQEKFIKSALRDKLKNSRSFLKFKKSFFSENKMRQPTNADLRETYEEMVLKRKIRRSKLLEESMISRAVRTQSGVAVIAVLTKPSSCPGNCIFCPTEKGMPKSYLSNEPAVMRAILSKFNPYKQVQSRIKALELNGHPTDKIELIVMGGTFSYFPKNYQKKFITKCFQACNDYPHLRPSPSLRGRLVGNEMKNTSLSPSSKIKFNLEHEQKRNEKSRHKIIGLTLETRPDYIDEKEILNFRKLGCTRVELGIQSIYKNVLELNNRGHGIQEVVNATKLLKNSGFKINYHMMPGLMGSSPQKDYKMFERLFTDPCFQPDMLKIYPTVVVKGTKLHKIWKNSKSNTVLRNKSGTGREYKPMTDRQFENLVIKIKNNVIPEYARIQRLVRDVPLPSIEAGPKISNLRQLVEKKSNCQCIRCREIKGGMIKGEMILDRIDYDSSDGKEIFLQFISSPSCRGGDVRRTDGMQKQKLYALLRLRIPSLHTPPPFQGEDWKEVLYRKIPALKNSALIREVHTYGKLVSVSKRDKKAAQHIGLGKKLIKEAERISKKEFGLNKIAVISGVGARDYYRKLGYQLQNTYMKKNI